jgi:hypothetical protein
MELRWRSCAFGATSTQLKIAVIFKMMKRIQLNERFPQVKYGSTWQLDTDPRLLTAVQTLRIGRKGEDKQFIRFVGDTYDFLVAVDEKGDCIDIEPYKESSSYRLPSTTSVLTLVKENPTVEIKVGEPLPEIKVGSLWKTPSFTVRCIEHVDEKSSWGIAMHPEIYVFEEVIDKKLNYLVCTNDKRECEVFRQGTRYQSVCPIVYPHPSFVLLFDH